MAPPFTTQLKATRKNIRKKHYKVGHDDDDGLDDDDDVDDDYDDYGLDDDHDDDHDDDDCHGLDEDHDHDHDDYVDDDDYSFILGTLEMFKKSVVRQCFGQI